MAADFRIVCLCGSAGALSAYVDILRAAPINSGMAFIVLTHRRLENPSWLLQILSGTTRMHVEDIADGTVIRPNCVYIGPAGKDLTTDGESLRLTPVSKVNGWPNTFDIFLESIAQHTYGRAVTVILSGLAKDGSAFLSMLRNSGGTNYAQSDASSDSMPRNAIATGQVDYVGSPTDIIAAIAKLPRRHSIARVNAYRASVNMNDSSSNALLLHSSRMHINQSRASILESEACLQISLNAIRDSQLLLRKSDSLIQRLHGERLLRIVLSEPMDD